MAGRRRKSTKRAPGRRTRCMATDEVIQQQEETQEVQEIPDTNGGSPPGIGRKRTRSNLSENESEERPAEKKIRASLHSDAARPRSEEDEDDANFFPAPEVVEAARARMSHHQLPPDGVEQHPAWNFADSDIVVRVPRKVGATAGDRVAFRLHRAVLARHMQPFADMEDLPEVGANEDNTATLDYDGDTASEWTLMCTLLYTPDHFGKDDVLWDDILLLFKLADKFCCLRFREAALAMLSGMFPTRLENFARRREINRVVCAPAPMCAAVLAATLIAEQYDVPEITPAVLLTMLNEPVETLGRKYPVARGSSVGVGLSLEALDSALSARFELLLNKQTRLDYILRPMLLEAREPGLQRDRRCQYRERRSPVGQQCHEWVATVFRDWRERFAKTPISERDSRIFDGLNAATLNSLGGQICEPCKLELERAIGRKQLALWEKMPRVAGYLGWEDMATRKLEGRRQSYQWFIDAEKERWARLNAKRGSRAVAVAPS